MKEFNEELEKKEKFRKALIEQVIETNYYLTRAIFNDNKNKISSYKKELDNLIDCILRGEK